MRQKWIQRDNRKIIERNMRRYEKEPRADESFRLYLPSTAPFSHALEEVDSLLKSVTLEHSAYRHYIKFQQLGAKAISTIARDAHDTQKN